MVYVISKTGQPIMPTENHAKVRLLLKTGKAKVVKRTPFTIQLTGTSKTFTQEVTLGVDAGSKHVGLSASMVKKELFSAELRPRNDVWNHIQGIRFVMKLLPVTTIRVETAEFICKGLKPWKLGKRFLSAQTIGSEKCTGNTT